ncbi:MAG: hypothetical protein AAGM22_03690 [Acidobacteriota bacterium]
MTSDSPSAARAFGAVLWLLVIASLVGCKTSVDVADLQGIYDQVARNNSDRNPVVVVPGILGTKLVHGDTGQVVWGAFGGSAIDPQEEEGARTFALPMATGEELSALTDDVVVRGVLESVEVRLAGLPIELQAYVEILATLGAGGYRDRDLRLDYGDDHFNCFQFGYDWRRDNVESAQRLYRFLKERRAYVEEERRKRELDDSEPIRFDVIAHSMGGLVLRYMLRYGDADLPADGSLPELTWAGAELVERAVLVGTPNAGATDALIQLVEGRKFGPFTPLFEPTLIGTLPSLYQLLPRPRHALLVDDAGRAEDVLDADLWRQRGWGLADPDQAEVLAQLLPDLDAADRRRVALDHLSKGLERARHFHAALDLPARAPPSTQLLLFAGDAEPTVAKVRHNADKGRLEVLSEGAGDGTVLRSSALMDERQGQELTPRLQTPIDWHSVQFLFADHLGLTSTPEFSDNVLYLLLEAPRLAPLTAE